MGKIQNTNQTGRRQFLRAVAGAAMVPLLSRGARAEDDNYPEARRRISFLRNPDMRFTHPRLASNSAEPVGLRLVNLFDTSGSVNYGEYQIQLDAMAEAISSKEFLKTVLYGPGSLAMAFVEFGDDQYLSVGWFDVRSQDDAWKLQQAAEELRAIKRYEAVGDNHRGALQAAMTTYDHAPWDGGRNVVDFLTDGDNSAGQSGRLPGLVDQLAREYNTTVNALITYDQMMLNNYGMDGYYEWAREHLATKPGYLKPDGRSLDAGFVMGVATNVDPYGHADTLAFRDAMKRAFHRKIIMEVAGLYPSDGWIPASTGSSGNLLVGSGPKPI